MTPDVKDITIIGGGPTGLFGAFYAGIREVSCRIVDSLPELGGQLTALYPEKYVYDVGGIPKILARDLAAQMIEQAMQFEPEVVLDEEVHEVRREEGGFRLIGDRGEYPSRALVIAGGKGAFEPKKLRVPGYEELLGKGVFYAVRDPEDFRDRRILIVGGGDSALDWTLALKDLAAELVLVHRRDGWRAQERSLSRMRQAAENGEIDVRTFHEVRQIHGDDEVERVTIFDNRTDDETVLEVDSVLTFLGFKPDLGPIKEWGLELERNRILVSRLMETSTPGIYAAGDVAGYEGKMDLIATGFAEAAIAVNQAVHWIDPDARVNPGHSTHLKVFSDR